MSATEGPITSAVGLSPDALVPVTAEELAAHVMTSQSQSPTVINIPPVDGNVVVNLADYRNNFRKTVCDAFGVEPEMVGLNSDYSMNYTPVGQSPLEWAREHQGLRDRRGWWFWKMWFKGKRVVFAEWLYKCVSGDPFPTQDW